MDGKKGPFYFDGVEDDKDTGMLTEKEGLSLSMQIRYIT